MEPDIHTILGRTEIVEQLCSILTEVDQSRDSNKGIYIYGPPGSGKTELVKDVLQRINADPVRYDASDVRNKAMIESIASTHISRHGVLGMMSAVKRTLVIVMDEIDGMIGGDKGGITALIKLVRRKKTRKQQTELFTCNPIICIGTTLVDKKIKELAKVCRVFELLAPTLPQMERIIPRFISNILPIEIKRAAKYANRDLRRIQFVKSALRIDATILDAKNTFIDEFFTATCNDNAKNIVADILAEPIPMWQHQHIIGESDRTVVSLLYHENVADAISAFPAPERNKVYSNILENMCFADYIDRVTFQNQIWIFNEMSSLLKTFYSNYKYHSAPYAKSPKLRDPRFTKILTKYSTEYNNSVFIQNVCCNIYMDKYDAFAFFREMQRRGNTVATNNSGMVAFVVAAIEGSGIKTLDVVRMFRYMDKNVVVPRTVVESISDDESCGTSA